MDFGYFILRCVVIHGDGVLKSLGLSAYPYKTVRSVVQIFMKFVIGDCCYVILYVVGTTAV
jgi:hypothetical protein